MWWTTVAWPVQTPCSRIAQYPSGSRQVRFPFLFTFPVLKRGSTMWLDILIFGGAGLLLFIVVIWAIVTDMKEQEQDEISYYESLRGKHSRGR